MRVIRDPPMRGEANMARDLALLTEATPTVRLYGWKPACVSLGRAQTEADVDMDVVREHGMDIVRRATGGGAILHSETEVTYAVILPLDHPGLPRDIPGSFAFMSRGIVHALQQLGIPAQIESVTDNTRETLCYVRKQGTNVVVGHQAAAGPAARKISGGAQRRTDRAVLQHGTIIVDRDEERAARLFRTPVDDIRTRVTSLVEEGVRIEREKLIELLAQALPHALV